MLGALDMYSIGIGPSSSHTIGPMRAAKLFLADLIKENQFNLVNRIRIDVFGSLALTGHGHGTVPAILNGLYGRDPKIIDTHTFLSCAEEIKKTHMIQLNGERCIAFNDMEDLVLHKEEFLPEHPNGMRFTVYGDDHKSISQKDYFSIGGGFVIPKDGMEAYRNNKDDVSYHPYPFKTATELFNLCSDNDISIAELVTRNELIRKTKAEIKNEALEIINVMSDSIKRGINSVSNILPGGLAVRRRAPELYKKLCESKLSKSDGKLYACCYAVAVNEENASFSRIVTAPTNGSAGTIPGVLEYYKNFCQGVTEDKMIEFILTAGAIGMLYKFGSSISAAEVGCQGEIGVACSMASAALTAVLGGSLVQIEKAAEIAMEHNLGMTCDPVNGLVQIPCIERNGIAAGKAIDIAYLALLEEESGKITLDQVIKTMLQTGKDMSSKYKETSLGGLAINIVSC